MRLMKNQWLRTGKWMGICLIGIALVSNAYAQAFSTTTVQGTVYLANGMPGSGTLQLNWPAFTTANNQAVAAGRTVAAIGADGFVSVNLAPNVGSFPGGLFYTAVYNMSDGSSNTEYWVVPAAAQATIAQVRAQVMPAAQAVHAVNKAYVDQAIQSLSQNYLAPSGGTLTGPLYLNGDPSQAMQAADKHYVDSTFSQAVPLTGASLTGPLTSVQLGAAYQADQFAGADFGAKLQACLAAVSAVNGGTCDARNFTGNQSMASNLTISTANTTVMLPCATISTASQVIVTAGTRNVALRGCALRGASNASGSQGGTVFQYSGVGAMIQVGDPTYAADTLGFHFDSAVINTTAATNSTAQALTAYRTQEMDLQSLYFLGNSNQTGMTLDGTGNYTGGTFYDNAFNGFQTAVNAIGHQVENSATTDWLNASTFVRLHIDCPTSSGNPINGTYGINLQQGDGNTFTGGDVEGCNIALHLGPNAQNNTIVGLRNENSNNQVVADSGSSYNNWMTGGTMFTGKLTDNGTRNSFLDTFHRSFNGMNGDWYGSQQDATVTNHFRLGTGNGNERGLLDRYQTDFGYRWTTGLSDATAGEQFYQVLDELNNVYRLSIGQYNNGQSSTNNQTVINAAGTGAVVLNGSNNSGTGGVVIGSGGIASATVATINNAGSAQFNGTLQVGSTSTFAGSTTVRNQADAEIDAFLWAGATANQKESLTYKDYAGASQWYVVKDASNNWALNSATGGLDSFKAYQSTNSGDTYINASNPSGVVRINYEGGAGTGFNVYGGNSSTLYAGFTGTTSIKFPGLAASSGHNCLQIDNSGYMTNTGSACGSGGGSGTVNSGASGQIAYYSAAGTVLSGMSAVPVASGGTGATSAAGALISLGAASLTAMGTQSFASPLNGPAVNSSVNSQVNVMAPPFNARGDCVTDDHDAIQAAMSAAAAYNPTAVVYFPRPAGGCYLTSTLAWNGVSLQGQPGMGTTYNTAGVSIQGKAGEDVFEVPSPSTVTTSAPNRTWSVRDLRIVVDDSVAGSFPHRWPGRWVSDAAITSGSATFTSSNSLITCGDIGQAILVKGAGIAGADLSTTISSVSPCWAGSQTPTSQVITLAAAASTTVAADQAYISVGNIPLTVTIGACGIAFDDIDGKQADNTMSGPVGNLYDTLRDVSFNSVGGGYGKNSSCALYFQGWWGPYGLDARNVNIGGVYYGVVEGSSETNSSFSTGGNDFQKWDHGLWSATYPWISYNGGDNKLEDIQLQGLNGPQILQFGNIWSDAANNWNIDMPEFAHVSGGATGWRIEGYAHTFLGTALGEDGTYTQPTLFDASDSQCLNCSMLGVLTINGSHN
ncbi:MAG: glycosyl hydrolase family 28-related protein, partial [Terracidiphilus sp.]